MMGSLSGTPVHVNRLLCTTPFLRWARTHRKARINKKWRKRYGAIHAPCPGVCYTMGSSFVMCPCAYAYLKAGYVARVSLKETKVRYVPG